MKKLSTLLRPTLSAITILAAFAGMPLARADTPEAAPIVALNAALIQTMKAGSANASFTSRYNALDPIVKAALNLPVIMQNSTGFYWSTLPAAQQQELLKVFEQFTVASYVSGFDGYGGQQIKVLPAERDVGDKKVVETQIVPGDGSDPTELDYVMTNGPNGWQATDVLLNGTISKVAIQSSDFSSEVTSGDASQLIAALKAKVATLSGGALSN
jgi:phospholipid transport system substrate-binding protein